FTDRVKILPAACPAVGRGFEPGERGWSVPLCEAPFWHAPSWAKKRSLVRVFDFIRADRAKASRISPVDEVSNAGLALWATDSPSSIGLPALNQTHSRPPRKFVSNKPSRCRKRCWRYCSTNRSRIG